MYIKRHIPNTITLMNLLAGSIAVLFAIKGWQVFSVILIFSAAIFDFFDGFSARLLKAYSPLGKELDSLADLVSFGLAPSFLLCGKFSQSISPLINSAGINPLYEIIAYFPLIITLASAYRLAKFNIDDKQKEVFLGLPTPANAIFIGSFIHFSTYAPQLDPLFAKIWFIPLLSVALSWLLICNIPMFSLKTKSISFKGNELRIGYAIFSTVAGIAIFTIGESWSLWLTVVFGTYILLNLILYISGIDVITMKRRQ